MCPLLHLTVQYVDLEALNEISVSFGGHKTIANRSASYTLYHVRVKRMDGTNWTTAVRYSEIAALRRELIYILPNLSKISFPGKTYFHFLSCMCAGFNRFDEQIISHRKQGMEYFLN